MRPVFDPERPLRPGVTVLEASAGTGKTYQISTLVARLVAEAGLPIDKILVVTFTRAATDELVDRVRGRLVECLAAAHDDPQAAGRLRTALQDFDQATISTIHGFCQRVLQQNAFESLADADAELLTDDRPLRTSIRADIIARLRYDATSDLRAFLDASPKKGGCGLDGEALDALLAQAARHPDATLVPEASAGVLCDDAGASHLKIPDDDAARAELAGQVRADVARFARAELTARAEQQRAQTFDDLLRLLAGALGPDAPEERRALLRDAVRQRYSAALIDEFQDTDRVQWTIFQTLFGGQQDASYLYLIGDPKQAIYGFRGANVKVYLEAVRAADADQVFTMRRNYRADARLVAGLNHLWRRDGAFGEPGIEYVQVEAEHQLDRLLPPASWSDEDPRRGALQLRFFDGALKRGGDPNELLTAGALGGLLAARVATDVVSLLHDGFSLVEEAGQRGLHPGDIAILVRSHFQAEALQGALNERGVPSVRSGAASVYASDEAVQLLAWLAAVAEPGRDGPARRAAATPLFGWRAGDLARLAADDPTTVARWDAWLDALGAAARAFERRGFMAAFRGAADEHDVRRRLLAWPDGERRLTNLLHTAELVHTAQTSQRLTPQATHAWLADQRSRVEQEEAGEAELRLERDDAAVQLLTMHKSKGLQFPVVFAPYLSDGRRLRDSHPLIVPDPAHPDRRLLLTQTDDEAAPRAELLVDAEGEAAREATRLAYVALTRACHRCYVYAGPSTRSGENLYAQSPIAALLHPGGDAAPASLWAEVSALAAAAPTWAGSASVGASRCEPPRTTRWTAPADSQRAPLRARPYTRGAFDGAWRVHSYTSLTRAHESPSADGAPEPAPGHDDTADRLRDGPGGPDVSDATGDPDVPLAGFAAGPDAGTFLHAVLENVDFVSTEDDPLREAAVGAQIEASRHRFGFSEADTGGLAPSFAETLRVPLGGPLGAFRLLDLPKADRLDELRFNLPISGPAGAAVAGSDLAAAFQPGGALSEGYVETLRSLRFGRLAGFLTGAIDLVFRKDGRWFVVDYKSNRIDPPRSGTSPLRNYRADCMRWEMERHHYLLQAHLYTCATHRFLRQRVPDYSYAEHFGGVAYLFLRGMTEPAHAFDEDGLRPGVFHLRPEASVVARLDELFAGGVVEC